MKGVSEINVESLWTLLVDEAPVGVGLVGLDLRFHRVNSAACEMLGYSEDELTRLKVSDVIHSDDREMVADGFSRLVAGEVEQVALDARTARSSGAERRCA